MHVAVIPRGRWGLIQIQDWSPGLARLDSLVWATICVAGDDQTVPMGRDGFVQLILHRDLRAGLVCKSDRGPKIALVESSRLSIGTVAKTGASRLSSQAELTRLCRINERRKVQFWSGLCKARCGDYGPKTQACTTKNGFATVHWSFLRRADLAKRPAPFRYQRLVNLTQSILRLAEIQAFPRTHQ